MSNYNGWRNYETWLTKLWMDESESSYHYYRDAAQDAKDVHELEVFLQADFEQGIAEQIPDTGLPADLFQHAARAIDWNQIACSLIDDLEEV